jgi:hypothetical protein
LNKLSRINQPWESPLRQTGSVLAFLKYKRLQDLFTHNTKGAHWVHLRDCPALWGYNSKILEHNGAFRLNELEQGAI